MKTEDFRSFKIDSNDSIQKSGKEPVTTAIQDDHNHPNEIELEQSCSGLGSEPSNHHEDDNLKRNHEDESQQPQPDRDSMKMFVGQIPRDWSEEDCRQLLEPFGQIYSINVLKEKDTKKSKGCCFVTYYTRKAALDAQNALHNLRKLPSCRNPIQMKPADNENKNDRKLFIGKLPKFITEQQIMQTFTPFGQIEECIILRDNHGQSKGCAFVTFLTRANAANAARELNQTKILEGCTVPIVVKFAESNDQKKSKNGHFMLPGNSAGILPTIGNVGAIGLPPSTFNPQHQATTPSASNISTYLAEVPLLDNPLMNLIKVQQQQQQLINLTTAAAAATGLTPHHSYLTPDVATYSNIFLTGSGTKFPLLTPNPILNNGNSSNNYGQPQLATAAAIKDNAHKITMTADGHCPLGTFPNQTSYTHHLHHPIVKNGPTIGGRQTEGPDGSNLFIYHLPAEYSDYDLIALFSPFGNVVSAKVFIDKNSNLSKCFGFVSYDNPESAQNAIRSMNGFQVMNKRLKVQLKKVREKPY